MGRASNQSYDALNRVKQQLQPPAAAGSARPAVNYAYDGLDQLSTVSDPRNLVTTYTNDGLGNRSALLSPDTGTTASTYDAAGNLKTSTDARGKVTTYSYDALNRLTLIDFVGWTDTRFEYDGGAAGAPHVLGKLTSMTDESGSMTYIYDTFGRLTGKTQTVNAGVWRTVLTVAYGYGGSGGAAGKLVSITYPSGNRVNYSYDDVGRLQRMTLNPVKASGIGTDETRTVDLLTGISYAPFGTVLAWNWGNSTAALPSSYRRSLDLDGRIASYTLGNPLTSGVLRTVTYDAAGQITSFTHSGAAAGGKAALMNQSFSYDNLGRLTGFVSNNTSQAFQYDANGNRTRATFGATSYTNTIAPASNRLMATSGPAPAKTNSYDASGNLISDGSFNNVYTPRGRLYSTQVGTLTLTQFFNGIGQRVQRSYGGGIFVYDEQGNLIGEYDTATGKATRETVYLGNMPVALLKQSLTNPGAVTATNVFYIYPDHLGTPRVITRASDSQIVWRWDSADPFGMMPPNENPGGFGVFTFNLRMPGQYYDRDVNIFYNYFRDYDPQIGRYVQSDPIGIGGGVNTFSYLLNNQISSKDKFGLVRKINKESQECISLKEKIARKKIDINKRMQECASNPGKLPYYPPFPGAPPRMSVQGHEDLIRDLKDSTQDDEKLYADKCGGDGGTATAPVTDGDSLKNAAEVAAGMGATYWIISEGLRVLFPPRNFIPIP